METVDYERQATNFLKETESAMTVKFLKHDKYFAEDGERTKRDIFRITLKRRGKKSFSFRFGQSLNESTGNGENKPSAYSVLACLTKYEVGTFENFCSDFGYNEGKLSDYPKVKKIYKAVKREFENVERMFSDVMAELAEIA